MIATLPAPAPHVAVWPTPRTRLATPQDLPLLMLLFKAMLQELEPLGHDVLPTPRNLLTYANDIFGPALLQGCHGIVLTLAHDLTPIAAAFFVLEQSLLDVPPGRAIEHGIYVVPCYRREGLATRLQEMAHWRLRQLGCTQIISNVVRDNEAGRKCAERAGAVVTGYVIGINLQEAM